MSESPQKPELSRRKLERLERQTQEGGKLERTARRKNAALYRELETALKRLAKLAPGKDELRAIAAGTEARELQHALKAARATTDRVVYLDKRRPASDPEHDARIAGDDATTDASYEEELGHAIQESIRRQKQDILNSHAAELQYAEETAEAAWKKAGPAVDRRTRIRERYLEKGINPLAEARAIHQKIQEQSGRLNEVRLQAAEGRRAHEEREAARDGGDPGETELALSFKERDMRKLRKRIQSALHAPHTLEEAYAAFSRAFVGRGQRSGRRNHDESTPRVPMIREPRNRFMPFARTPVRNWREVPQQLYAPFMYNDLELACGGSHLPRGVRETISAILNPRDAALRPKRFEAVSPPHLGAVLSALNEGLGLESGRKPEEERRAA